MPDLTIFLVTGTHWPHWCRDTNERLEIYQETSTNILDAIYGCTRLQELSLADLVLESLEQWLDPYDSFWSRLLVVNVLGTWSSTQGLAAEVMERLANTGETMIETLIFSMEGSKGDLLHQVLTMLIVNSPALVRLVCTIGSTEDTNMVTLLAAGIESKGRVFYRLKYLELYSPVIVEKDFQVLLESMPALEELNMKSTGFNTESWQILLRRVSSAATMLETLNLKRCKQVTGVIINDILCSIPSLTHLDRKSVV